MLRATAKIRNTVIAETDKWETVEGNVYFPRSSLKDSTGTFSLIESDASTFCPWKGAASYYDIAVQETGTVISDAAWYYSEPYKAAQNIKDHVAFYNTKVDVVVE
ncbi:hypothetical protein AJ78_06940 [Emergomyces pasteurianus Ep9510]|uniref:DUF427 domain-containing protein n=1 Tax=Emergomyces pasteurianus Ep9510 TaxID=1447872 RepID=A0A1J9QBE1_9EURO|nr:hypothetical protein AJ78_06940 [Emergomyces pasteurianus Ep9510]